MVAILAIGMSVYILYARTVKIYDDKVITNTGVYRLSDNRRLKVWNDDRDFVRARLTQKGETIIDYKEPASTFQKFRVMWESATRRLWVNSSDIGAVVYIPGNYNKHVATYLTPQIYQDYDKPQMLIEQVPSDIRAKMDLD